MPHTPGPWIAVETCEGVPLPAGVACSVQTESEPYKRTGRICEMNGQGPDGKYSSATTQANADLIAAAPEMLELLEWLDHKGGLGLDVHERLKTVVAKATRSKTR